MARYMIIIVALTALFQATAYSQDEDPDGARCRVPAEEQARIVDEQDDSAAPVGVLENVLVQADDQAGDDAGRKELVAVLEEGALLPAARIGLVLRQQIGHRQRPGFRA